MHNCLDADAETIQGRNRMKKYIAIFTLPDDYVMGCACGKMCPNDGKVRSDRDFEDVYAQIEPLAEKQDEVFGLFNSVERLFQDLGLSNAYDMPSFWCNGGKDYKVIPTNYHKGYMQALEDVEREVRLRFGFSERTDVFIPNPFGDNEA